MFGMAALVEQEGSGKLLEDLVGRGSLATGLGSKAGALALPGVGALTGVGALPGVGALTAVASGSAAVAAGAAGAERGGVFAVEAAAAAA